MIDETCLGNWVDGSWTTEAYNNVVTALRQLGWVGITKNNVKNKQKTLKDIWRDVHIFLVDLVDFPGMNPQKYLMSRMKFGLA